MQKQPLPLSVQNHHSRQHRLYCRASHGQKARRRINRLVRVQHRFGALTISAGHLRPEIRLQLCKAAKHSAQIPPHPSPSLRQVKKVPHRLQQITLKTIRLSHVSRPHRSLPLQLPPHGNSQLIVQCRRQAPLSHQGKRVQGCRRLYQPH